MATRGGALAGRARQESNLRPSVPETDALSPELRALGTAELSAALASRPVQLAIISDTHMPRGARALPAACVERLRAADAILHAGDLVALEVLELLESLGPPVHAVHGNVDEPEVRIRLPAVRVVEAEGARILLTHDGGPAQGRLARLRRRYSDADAVVFGHSHLPLHEHADGFHIFNPGSPTERRRAPRHTMGVATASRGRLEFELVELDPL
jgi:putative phosphoesterase